MSIKEDPGTEAPGEPRVGIYWMYKGRLFHVVSEPVSRGIKTSIAVDGHFGHYQMWPAMERKGILDTLPENLRDEYDSIERGRVVYNFARGAYVIFHGNPFTPENRQEVVEAFCLREEPVEDEVDEHYNPLPEDFIF